MKRFITILLILSLVFSLTACGGKEILSEEQISFAEECGRLAGTVHTYQKTDTIDDIVVLIPTGEKTVISLIEELCGSLEYYNSDASVKNADAIVIETKGTIGAEGASNTFVNICGVAAEGDAAGTRKVLVTFNTADGTVAVDAGSDVSVITSVSYNGADYKLDSSKSAPEGVKWLLAQQSLDLDKWKEQQAEALTEALTAYDEAKSSHSGDWEGSVEFYQFLNSNGVYRVFYEKSEFVDYLTRLSDALEGADEAQQAAIYNEFTREMTYNYSVAQIMKQKAEFAAKSDSLLQAAAEDFSAYESQINELKKDDGYLDSDEFLKIKARSNPIAVYQDNLAAIDLLDASLKVLEESYNEENANISSLITKFGDVENDYTVAYYQARMNYIRAVVALEDFDSKNAAELDAYNSAIDNVKAKHTDGSDYKKDVDYMKIELEYKDLLSQRSTLEAAVKELKAAVDEINNEFAEDKEEYENDVKETLDSIARANDMEKIKKAARSLVEKLGELNSDPKQSESFILGELEGFAAVKMSSDIISSANSARDVYVPHTSGSGSSGGGRTCAKPGCSNKAVTSGDSVYCSTHSRRCGNCGCYIDADAMYCMDCLRKALQR